MPIPFGEIIIQTSSGPVISANRLVFAAAGGMTITGEQGAGGTGTITFTGGGGGVSTLTGNTGTASPTAGNINIYGSGPLTVSGSGDTLTVSMTTPLSVANGGTGTSLSWDAGAVVFASTSTALSQTAAGAAGQLLYATGAGSSGWTAASYPTGSLTAYSILYASSRD